MTEHLFSRPRSCATTTIARRRICLAAAALYLAACGSPVDNSIDKLSGGPDERALAKHELILAGEDAVEPIVAAFEDRGSSTVRPELAEVLVSMLLRSEDEPILLPPPRLHLIRYHGECWRPTKCLRSIYYVARRADIDS